METLGVGDSKCGAKKNEGCCARHVPGVPMTDRSVGHGKGNFLISALYCGMGRGGCIHSEKFDSCSASASDDEAGSKVGELGGVSQGHGGALITVTHSASTNVLSRGVDASIGGRSSEEAKLRVQCLRFWPLWFASRGWRLPHPF